MNMTESQKRQLAVIERLKEKAGPLNRRLLAIDGEVLRIKELRKKLAKQLACLAKEKANIKREASKLNKEIASHASMLASEDDTTGVAMSAAKISPFTRTRYDEGSNSFDNAVSAYEGRP